MPNESFSVSSSDGRQTAQKDGNDCYRNPFLWLSVVLLAVVVVLGSMLATSNAGSGTSASSSASAPIDIDFSKVVGFPGKPGVGKLSGGLTGVSWSDWAPWGLALSGNGFMAMAAAAGVLRSLHEVELLQRLASISSVSGGSWFLTQFAFSEGYYQSVLDNSMPIDTWYTSYQKSAVGGMMQVTSPTWEAQITGMYNGYDPALKSTPADKDNALQALPPNLDLLFCTTLVGGSLMSDNSTIVQLKNGLEKAFYSNPAYWLVPSEGKYGDQGKGKCEYKVPGVDLTRAVLTKVNAKVEEIHFIQEVLPTPSVTKIGAMSSAANGITANPELSALFKPQDQYFNMFGSGLQPANGVCTTAEETCSFPSMMAMDGCYVDNLGFALNVGHLQKKYPGKHLRMMAVSSEICDRTADPTCVAGVKVSAFRSLFGGSPYPEVEGWLPAVVPGPNRVIFAESVTDVEALGQQTGYGGMSFTTGTFTTVENKHFGVAAGTKVALLVLNVHGQPYLAPFGPGVPSGAMDGFSNVALNAQRSMNQIFTALSTNGEVDGSTAFMYYQTVQRKAPEEPKDLAQTIV